MKISGLKLNFDDSGSIVVESGKKQLPYRVELIEKAFAEKDYDSVIEMLFNYRLKNCRHTTNKEMVNREIKIATEIIELIEKGSI